MEVVSALPQVVSIISSKRSNRMVSIVTGMPLNGNGTTLNKFTVRIVRLCIACINALLVDANAWRNPIFHAMLYWKIFGTVIWTGYQIKIYWRVVAIEVNRQLSINVKKCVCKDLHCYVRYTFRFIKGLIIFQCTYP